MRRPAASTQVSAVWNVLSRATKKKPNESLGSSDSTELTVRFVRFAENVLLEVLLLLHGRVQLRVVVLKEKHKMNEAGPPLIRHVPQLHWLYWEDRVWCLRSGWSWDLIWTFLQLHARCWCTGALNETLVTPSPKPSFILTFDRSRFPSLSRMKTALTV